MTTDFHLLGANDERLVSQAREAIYAMCTDKSNDYTEEARLMADLVDRVYKLHEIEEELAEEKMNADNLQGTNDELRDGIKVGVQDLEGLAGKPLGPQSYAAVMEIAKCLWWYL